MLEHSIDWGAVKIKGEYLFWLTGLFLFLAAVWWPGDAPWINDEPVLISNAWVANQNKTLANHGLQGSFGAFYGPVPTWIYQLLLRFTHNLVFISLLKNASTFIILFGCLYLIARKFELARHPILLIFVSPYLYFYGRILWDNCFLIPVSALMFLFYILFSFHRSAFYFYALIFITVTLIHIHLMALLVICPLAAMVLVFDWDWLRNHGFAVMTGIVGFVLTCIPYLSTAVAHIYQEPQFKASITKSIFNAVAGVKFFSFIGFADYFLPEIYSPEFPMPLPITNILLAVSGFSFVFFLLGIFFAVKELINKGNKLNQYSVHDKLSLLCVACLLVNLLFFMVSRHKHHPHYFNASWFPYFFLLWQGAGTVLSRGRVALSYSVFFASMVTMFVFLICFIHLNGGNRLPYYGATLANQIGVAKHIVQFSPKSRLVINVRNYRFFPHGLYTLIRLYSPQGHEQIKHRPVSQLTIDYRDQDRSRTGWIEVREVAENPAAE